MTTLRAFILAQSTLATGATVRGHIKNGKIGTGDNSCAQYEHVADVVLVEHITEQQTIQHVQSQQIISNSSELIINKAIPESVSKHNTNENIQ